MEQRFHQTEQPARAPRARHQHLPPGTGTFGMVLFLLSLGMLFAASVVGYLVIRFQPTQPLPPGELELPAVLWASTVAILASSFTIHTALQNVRLERQTRFRQALTLTLLLAVAFLLLQAPGLSHLLYAHRLAEDVQLYGLVFFLVLVHAAHLLGGLLPLTVITYQAHAGRYDHEHHGPVQYIVMYWHFLDAVWVILFGVFLVAG